MYPRLSHLLHSRKGKYAHSPFVYQLSMAVFEKKSPVPTASYHFGNDKYGQLTAKIAAYFDVKTIAHFPSDHPAQAADLTLINMTPQPEIAYDYFEETVKYSGNNSVVIVKDMYRSQECAAVWEKIKAHPKTTVTLDLFKMGIVFFRRESSKENFIIKY